MVVLALPVLAGTIALLLWKRDDARRYASDRTIEFIQQSVEKNLSGSDREDATEEFQLLREALTAGRLEPDQILPLLETFSDVFADRHLDASEVGRIRDKVKDLVGTLGDS